MHSILDVALRIIIITSTVVLQCGCAKNEADQQSTAPLTQSSEPDEHRNKKASDATLEKSLVEPIKVRKEKGAIDRTVRTYVLRPGEGIRSVTGGIWMLLEVNKDSIVFGPQPKFDMDANPPGGFPSGDYSMGNDQYIRIINVQHDPPSVTLELEYREGILQDLAF